MKLSVYVAALAAVAVHAIAAYADSISGNPRVTCETSDASPYIHHIDQLTHGLRFANGETCFSDNLGYTDHHCGPTIKDFSGENGGAAFSLCSGKISRGRAAGCAGGPPGKTSCENCAGWDLEEIARMIDAIRNKCKSPHRAGGVYHLQAPASENREGGQVRLYTMPDRM